MRTSGASAVTENRNLGADITVGLVALEEELVDHEGGTDEASLGGGVGVVRALDLKGVSVRKELRGEA